VVSPESTLERVRPLLPVMGITRIANVTGLDTIGIPVVMVCRPNSRSVAVSQGKGLTLAAAKASGVMESVEGYHAEHIALPLKYSSYEELRYSHQVADPEDLPKTCDSLFHPNLPLLWIETHDLATKEPVWLPYELAHLNFTLPDLPGTGCFVVSANGLASGNHWLEAVSHAICEVVERDAATLWSLQREAHQQATRLDLDSVDDPDCRRVLEILQKAGVAVGVWDMTTEIGLPVFACLIAERERNPLRPLPGGFLFGCHPVREIALLRALTECAQERLALISGSRDDLYWNYYEFHGNWEHWEKQRGLLLETSGTRRFEDAPTFHGDTLLDDVRWEIERLHSAGFQQILALDLTKPEFGLPVARVVIPGLEPKFREKKYRPGKRARARMA
jgi:YcaO-like protein with predicted kinase domain